MREIILDTETTGLDPKSGHRLVEIGCVEIMNLMPTGREFHTYINPERDVPESAFAVHGLSAEFLAKHPRFADVADAFIEFIAEDALVIHNAAFDMGFLNTELERLQKPLLPMQRVIDTIPLARAKFPGARVNLDALCQRFAINNSHRDKHGALLDAHLLAQVYLELKGGRQPDFTLGSDMDKAPLVQESLEDKSTFLPILAHTLSDAATDEHKRYIDSLPAALWKKYYDAA